MKRFFVALTLLTALFICLHSGYAQDDPLDAHALPPPPVDDPPVDDPPIDDPSVVDDPPIDDPSVVDDPPIDDPSVVDDPPVDEEVHVPEITPVMRRTAAVADAIVDALPHRGHAADVTTEDLATITELTITNSASQLILALTDFEGLTGLTTLDLSNNLIAYLPWGGYV